MRSYVIAPGFIKFFLMNDRNEEYQAIGLLDCLIGYQCVSPALACVHELMLLLPAPGLDFKLLKDLSDELMLIQHEVFIELVRDSDAMLMWPVFIDLGYEEGSVIGRILRNDSRLWRDFEVQAQGYERLAKWCGAHR